MNQLKSSIDATVHVALVCTIHKKKYRSLNSRLRLCVNKAVSDGGVFNIRSLIHLVTLQLLYRHTHRHTDTQSL